MVKKFLRYIKLYGLRRTVFKAVGRTKVRFNLKYIFFNLRRSSKKVGLIGAGQFGLTTISFFLLKKHNLLIAKVADISRSRLECAKESFGINELYLIDEYFNFDDYFKGLDLVYVASNHSTHADYAIQALRRDVDVYCEKPLATTTEQLELLFDEVKRSKANFYCGYNRPFSPAIEYWCKETYESISAITLNCSVYGHVLDQDHWYRHPEEGTRICGNMGHWLDLFIYLISKRHDIFVKYTIAVSYSSTNERDENISISITNIYSDIFNITLSARHEPYEGILEFINLQDENSIMSITDFREFYFWSGDAYKHKKYFYKDVGHSKAVSQPFGQGGRRIDDLFVSSQLMLHISEMVKDGSSFSIFEPSGYKKGPLEMDKKRGCYGVNESSIFDKG